MKLGKPTTISPQTGGSGEVIPYTPTIGVVPLSDTGADPTATTLAVLLGLGIALLIWQNERRKRRRG